MVAATSAGLFGNLGANHGKLNTKRGKSFLWRDSIRRMEGTNLKIQEKLPSKTKLKRLRERLKKETGLVRQKHILILINSALLAALAIKVIT